MEGRARSRLQAPPAINTTMHRYIQTEPVWIEYERAAAIQGRAVIFPDSRTYPILLCARTDDFAAPYIFDQSGIRFLSEAAIVLLEQGGNDLRDSAS